MKTSVHRQGLSRLDDEALLAMFLKGEHAAFNVLLGRYKRPLLGFIGRFVQDKELGEDIFQETFLRVIKGAQEFQGRSRFKTWLFRIARNLCIDRLRHEGLLTMVSADQPDDEDSPALVDRMKSRDPGPDTAVLRGDLAAKVESALEYLAPEQREVFLLRAVVELPFAEIAEVTGVSENTVKSRMRYALDGLRRALAGRDIAVSEAR